MKLLLLISVLLVSVMACVGGSADAPTPEPTIPPEFEQQAATILVQEHLERGDGCVPPYDNWWRREYWREDYHGHGVWSVYWADPGIPGERYQWHVTESTGEIEEIANPYAALC